MRFMILAGILIISFGLKAQDKQMYASDVASIENLTKTYYEIISGPIGQKRDFERLRNLFHPSATFTYAYWSEQEEKAKLMQFDFDDYVKKLSYLDKKGFYEEEISNSVQEYGTMVNVVSVYEFWMEDQTAEGRGVTNYHYFFDGQRYWIMSMFWQMESAQFPIPKKFISKK